MKLYVVGVFELKSFVSVHTFLGSEDRDEAQKEAKEGFVKRNELLAQKVEDGTIGFIVSPIDNNDWIYHFQVKTDVRTY